MALGCRVLKSFRKSLADVAAALFPKHSNAPVPRNEAARSNPYLGQPIQQPKRSPGNPGSGGDF
jgi:hypothetical protein